MKFAAAALVLATSVIAAPSTSSKREACTFGTYRCTADLAGIEICNVQSQWELVGDCPEGLACENLPSGGSELPFCTEPKTEKRNGRPGQGPGDSCTTPGKYDCYGPYAIQVCNTSNVLEFVGDCPERSHCSYLNDIAYCVASV